MKERPILFSAPMVLSTLDGSKEQTRRTLKPQPVPADRPEIMGPWHWWNGKRGARDRFVTGSRDEADFARELAVHCPYGVPGDRLYVKERWQFADWTEDGMPWIRYAADGATKFFDSGTVPEAWGERLTDTWADLSAPANVAIDGKAADRRWRPSLFLPRWASRITLEITDVRAQRLQQISEDDARAEGVEFDVWDQALVARDYSTSECWLQTWSDRMTRYVRIEQLARASYRTLWESINGAGSWALNPWVFAISFRRAAP
jgi:hypothetical protein